MRHLLAAGISPDTTDACGRTSLHAAAKQGWPYIVQHLFEAKADVNRKDKDGNTPLDLAIHYDHFYVVELPSKMGAEKTEGGSPIQKQWDQIYEWFESKDAVMCLLAKREEPKKTIKNVNQICNRADQRRADLAPVHAPPGAIGSDYRGGAANGEGDNALRKSGSI